MEIQGDRHVTARCVERKIGKASVGDAIIGTGVAIDKMLGLRGHSERYSEHSTPFWDVR